MDESFSRVAHSLRSPPLSTTLVALCWFETRDPTPEGFVVLFGVVIIIWDEHLWRCLIIFVTLKGCQKSLEASMNLDLFDPLWGQLNFCFEKGQLVDPQKKVSRQEVPQRHLLHGEVQAAACYRCFTLKIFRPLQSFRWHIHILMVISRKSRSFEIQTSPNLYQELA